MLNRTNIIFVQNSKNVSFSAIEYFKFAKFFNNFYLVLSNIIETLETPTTPKIKE